MERKHSHNNYKHIVGLWVWFLTKDKLKKPPKKEMEVGLPTVKIWVGLPFIAPVQGQFSNLLVF